MSTGDPNIDPFVAAWTTDGFSSHYTRALKSASPNYVGDGTSLGEIKARHEAHAATANPLAALGLGTPAPAPAAPAAVTETAPAPAADARTEEVRKLSPEDRDAYLTAIFAVQYENGEYATPAIPDSDEWEDE